VIRACCEGIFEENGLTTELQPNKLNWGKTKPYKRQHNLEKQSATD